MEVAKCYAMMIRAKRKPITDVQTFHKPLNFVPSNLSSACCKTIFMPGVKVSSASYGLPRQSPTRAPSIEPRNLLLNNVNSILVIIPRTANLQLQDAGSSRFARSDMQTDRRSLLLRPFTRSSHSRR